ncbi:MAG: potassium/proton antiporter [Lachnospiraceae bacterium]|nr:potassium/proton antiporter [Lachnospiraceae bacterium]
MTVVLLLVAIVILLCVLAEKFSGKFGMPALILFMFIGMAFGSDGFLKIPFNDYKLSEYVCSIALLFIMFYGGFNLKWTLAKNVAVKSVLLSTIGVAVTAAVTALFVRMFLGYTWTESFLVGAVLGSTDAASVFAILRQKKLNLKDSSASLLEMESGSNDPMAYMLTFIAMGILSSGEAEHIVLRIFLQLVVGSLIGVILARLTIRLMTRTTLVSDGLDTIFMIAMVLICYSLSQLLGGNAYLSIYIMGIIIGNSPIKNKATLIPFFDGVTTLAQILIFFLLGLLTIPHEMSTVIIPAIIITVILTLIARPAAVFLLLKPFRCSTRQCLLVSWAGLRGASSSVFAIMAVAGGVIMPHNLFHIVFMVSLFSVAIQGTLLPRVAEKLDMIDEEEDVRKTFNDYQEDSSITLVRMYIPKGHNWENKLVKEVNFPTGSLALMIKRNHETIITKGDTLILADDSIILSAPSYNPTGNELLDEIFIDRYHPWCNRTIADLNLASDELIAMIIRGEESLIPDGKTRILEGDKVVTYHE